MDILGSWDTQRTTLAFYGILDHPAKSVSWLNVILTDTAEGVKQLSSDAGRFEGGCARHACRKFEKLLTLECSVSS